MRGGWQQRRHSDCTTRSCRHAILAGGWCDRLQQTRGMPSSRMVHIMKLHAGLPASIEVGVRVKLRLMPVGSWGPAQSAAAQWLQCRAGCCGATPQGTDHRAAQTRASKTCPPCRVPRVASAAGHRHNWDMTSHCRIVAVNLHIPAANRKVTQNVNFLRMQRQRGGTAAIRYLPPHNGQTAARRRAVVRAAPVKWALNVVDWPMLKLVHGSMCLSNSGGALISAQIRTSNHKVGIATAMIRQSAMSVSHDAHPERRHSRQGCNWNRRRRRGPVRGRTIPHWGR